MTTFVSYEQAAEILKTGGAVALPTDTVYGLGVLPVSDESVRQLYALKKRPDNVALPVLCASVEQAERAGIIFTPQALRLASAFWPGALTMILRAPSELAARVHSGEATVGVRIPNDDRLRSLLEQTGPLCVTSANEHGEAPCTSASMVAELFDGRELSIVDGGVRSASVSTVVVVGENLELKREGAIRLEELLHVLS